MVLKTADLEGAAGEKKKIMERKKRTEGIEKQVVADKKRQREDDSLKRRCEGAKRQKPLLSIHH